MMQRSSNIDRCLFLSAIAGGVISCGSFADDSEQYSELDRLRVLAIRSEPADLALGETATLDAFIFEPNAREVEYEWTWCPSRADASGDFKCNVSEKDLERAWDDLGMAGDAPTYDLGTQPTAQFTHLFSPELVAATCAALGKKQNAPEQVVLACAMGLQPSVQLRVKTARAQITAVKDLSLLMQETPEEQRNRNPESGFEVRVRRFANQEVVRSNQTLVAGGRYVVDARFDQDNAEAFSPMMLPDGENQEQKNEQLVMSWFFTVGQAAAPEEDEGFGPEDRTTFVPGSSNFDAFLKNGWQVPLTATGEAKIVLVVRDERGGVAWSERQFDVEAP